MRAASYLLIVCLLAASLVGCSQAPATPREQLDALYKSADWLGSVDLSTKLLQQSPEDTDLLYCRAQSYLALKMYDESIADFTKMIEKDPNKADWYYGRELAYSRSGRTELANADGAKGREIDIRYKTAYPFESRNFASPSGISAEDLAGERLPQNGNDSNDESQDPYERERDTSDSLADSSAERSNPWDEPHSNDDPTDEGVYDPINEASSILDRAMSEGGAADASVAGTPKVAEQSNAAVELAENMARLRSANQADNVANNKVEDLVADDGIADLVAERLKAKPKIPGGDAFVGPRPFVPDEPTPMPDNFVTPPQPTISTALPSNNSIANPAPGVVRPLGMPAAPGVAAPRSTGISSNRPVTALPLTSNGSLGIPGIAGTPQTTGIQPGQFQGNTIYTPGSPRPTLSTSLPGTGQQVPSSAPGFVPQRLTNGPRGLQRRGPVLSTQLPANRAVTPRSMARPTGIISNGR